MDREVGGAGSLGPQMQCPEGYRGCGPGFDMAAAFSVSLACTALCASCDRLCGSR
jgi:hypothetical protein